MIRRGIVFIAAVACACGGDRRAAGTAAGRDTGAQARRETPRDSAADPPCMALHVGLPCQ
jgi:hypothetical protein